MQYKLLEGDIAVFDNLRIMHGREGYAVQSEHEEGRLLYGCYMDWDEVNDKLRVLKKGNWI